MAKSTKKTKPASLHETLQLKATAYMEDEQKLLQKHGLNRRIIVTFPHRKTVPLMGKFAVWLLKKSKAVIDTEFGLMRKQ